MEQQSAPWRVFDAPSASDGGSPGSAVSPANRNPAGVSASQQRLAIVAIAGALAIGAIAVVIAISGAGGAILEAPGASAGAEASMAVGAGGAIVVDVTGAVTKPGVYRLAAGARVGDAIEAAGGFSPRVDADRVALELNLAASVTDGAQVHVPSRDEPAATAGGAGGSGNVAGGGGAGALVNLNTATESELDALPGIGPVTAGKIIESRSGAPFKTVEELRERGLVGEKTFDKLKPLITVG